MGVIWKGQGVMIKLREMRWVGHLVCTGEKKNVYKILAGKPEGQRPL
jgi:hypothetical protein